MWYISPLKSQVLLSIDQKTLRLEIWGDNFVQKVTIIILEIVGHGKFPLKISTLLMCNVRSETGLPELMPSSCTDSNSTSKTKKCLLPRLSSIFHQAAFFLFMLQLLEKSLHHHHNQKKGTHALSVVFNLCVLWICTQQFWNICQEVSSHNKSHIYWGGPSACMYWYVIFWTIVLPLYRNDYPSLTGGHVWPF